MIDVLLGKCGRASDGCGETVCFLKDMADGAASFSGSAHFRDMEEDFVGCCIACEHDAVRREDASADGGDADIADVLSGDFFLNFLSFVYLNSPETDQDHRIYEKDAECDDDDSDSGKKRRVHTDSPVVGNLTLY